MKDLNFCLHMLNIILCSLKKPAEFTGRNVAVSVMLFFFPAILG